MLKGMLFDVDGTLVLSNDAHAAAWEEAFARMGYEVPFAEIRPLIGMGGDKLLPKLRPELTDSEGDGKKIKDLRQQIFLTKYAPQLQAAPGSRALVEAMQQQGLQTVIVGSSSQDELQALLQAAKMADLFTETTTADDTDHSKPDPDMIQAALDKLDLAANEVVMLGDTPYDIEAADKAGIPCIAVRCGGRSDDELKEALAIFDDPADFLAQGSTVLTLLAAK